MAIMLRAQRQPLLQFKRHFSLDVSSMKPANSISSTDKSTQGRNRLSNKFIPMTKDKPSNSADTSSHQILLKAGFVRQVQDTP